MSTPESFANHYQTTLSAAVTAGALTGTVTSATGIPAVPFRAIISGEGSNTDEVVLVTAVSGTTLTWTRAVEAVAGSQTASAHGYLALLTAIVSARGLMNVVDRGEQAAAYLYDDTTAGESVIAMDYATCDAAGGTTVYGRKQASTNILQTSTNGSTIVDKFTFTAGEIITAIKTISATVILVTTADVATTSAPSTYTYIYRSSDGGTNFTKVASSAAVIGSSVQLVVGNYFAPWSFAYNGTAICAGLYGYKANSTARYIYRSTDAGVTWSVALDVGANSNRHVHQVYADPNTNRFWAVIGDDTASRQAYVSADNGVTWTANIFYDTNGTTRLQFTTIVAYRGWLYLGEDSGSRGRILRFRESDPQGTIEVVYDPDLDGTAVTFAGLTGSSPMVAPIYNLAADATNQVLYAFAQGESPSPYTNHGRFMASPDGINWVTLSETGTSINVATAHFSIQEFSGGHFVFYNKVRMKRRLAYRAQGLRPVQQQTFTFSIPGAIATQAEVFALNANHLGYSFRLVRAGIFVQTASSGTIVAVFKRDGTTVATTEATVAGSAVTTARYAEITLIKTGAMARFIAEISDLLTVDITNNGVGGTGLTGFIVVEQQLAPALVK